MKKWGMILSLIGALVISTEAISQSVSAFVDCCYMSKIATVPDCCKGDWGNEENFEWRGGTCCSINNVTAAYAISPDGVPIRGSVITRECCMSQKSKGKDPGNYVFWPTQGSANVANDPGTGGVCCIVDSWKWWSTGSNNGRCCRAQGGVDHDNHCCFEAYDLDAKGHSKECCKATEGKWENGECCAKDGKGTALANQMDQQMSLDGSQVLITMSGAKITSNCCSADGGKAYNTLSEEEDLTLACCIGGEPYGVSYDADNNLVEGCCKKPKKVTDLGDLDACCEEGEEGYIATTTGEGGEEEKEGACCKGEVFIKKFVEPRDGNYGNMACCPIGEYVIDGACCKNQDDKVYPNSDFYDCCPSSHWADPDCCESASSVKDVKGNISEACCENAGGTWVGNSSGGGSDVTDAGFCCNGSLDLISGERTEECCQNASGKWMGTFCCGTWGKKVNGACEAESLPDSGSGGAAGGDY